MHIGGENMKIQFAKPQDKEKIKEIWHYCFGDKDPFLTWYFNVKYRENNTLVVYDDEMPVSSLQLLSYQLHFHGQEINTSYIVGVDTLPEARGKGYVKALLKESLMIMKERGQMISILLPFQYEFYRKYGWETCYYHKRYEIKPTALKSLINQYGQLRPINFQKDTGQLMQIYKKFTQNRHGYIARTWGDWKCIFDDLVMSGEKGYVIEGNNGMAEGYILYKIKDKVLNIYEMAYRNHEAYCGLLWFAYSHSAQVDKITWKAPADDITYAYLNNPKQSVQLEPFVMARVVDVEAILRLLVKNINSLDNFSIHIEDPFADWNCGTFYIDNNDIQKRKNEEADVRFSINIFTQLVMGFILPVQGYQLGLVKVKDDAALQKMEKIFKVQNNYINDYY